MSIELTERDMAILSKMLRRRGLDTSLTSSGWQPSIGDVAAVDDMIRRGILEKKPGFDSIQTTEAGWNAWQDRLDAEGERRVREGY